jgi:hypothetical protein
MGSAALMTQMVCSAARAEGVLGQGDFRYRIVPAWGVLGAETPVKNCHGIVCDQEGNLILLTDDIRNNFIVYDASGKLLHKWGTEYPGAHGLSLVTEGGKELLYYTDLERHMVFRSTLSGEITGEWEWPAQTGKYAKKAEYRPSWTLHRANGEFFVLDGYGRDFIIHYGADGKQKGIFGGQEGGIAHWGPHGGMIDRDRKGEETLLIAMSDQQHLLRLDLQGNKLAEIALPGGNPRQIKKHGDHYFVAHLADNWPADRDSHGFLSVLDSDLKVISNIAGHAPEYGDDGKLRKMSHRESVFLHPHDLAVGKDGSIYVAQFASKNTYPIKLERI